MLTKPWQLHITLLTLVKQLNQLHFNQKKIEIFYKTRLIAGFIIYFSQYIANLVRIQKFIIKNKQLKNINPSMTIFYALI
ncbi:hypothetical protein CG431_06310 [Pantoea ananatis]|nr:hypothetical protein CG431_06310 [Pantoea ananatis]